MQGRFDATRPNIARVYDALLGGKNNFAADRELAAKLIAANPRIPRLLRENKAFLARAAEWAARRGISQFIDLGSGLPASPSVHGAARAVIPAARVVYVDRDPVVISHVAALSGRPGVTAVRADLRDPAAVTAAAQDAGIDLAAPCCIILGLVLHTMDTARAREVTAGYTARIAPGSYVIMSSGHGDPQTGELAGEVAALLRAVRVHSREEFASFFAGLEMVAPGVCDARAWKTLWQGRPAKAGAGTILCGVARKPR